MADRWTGDRSRSRSRSRSRDRDRRRRSTPPRDRDRDRRVHSRSPERRRDRDGDERRRRSRSRSRSRGRYDRDSRRDRSPPSRRDGGGGYSGGRRRSSSRSPGGRRGYDGGSRGHRGGSRSRSPPSLPPPRAAGGQYDRAEPPRMQQGGRDFRPPPPPLSDAPPEVGSIHRARVVSVRPFGAFVELTGYRKQALVHHSQVSEDIHFGREDDDDMKVKAMEFFLPRGEQVWVKVLEVRPEPGGPGFKLACSMRAVEQESGRDLDPDNLLAAQAAGGRGGPGGGPGGGGGRDRDDPPELYSIHRAAVQQVRPFGVFVKLDGYRKYGLVHFSQISDHLSFSRDDSDDVKVREIGEILAVGDSVWVKVVDVTQDERGPKVGCSIKHVSQNDGTDLDPANTKYRPRGEGGGGFQGQQPIGATAGATTHDGAVDWGHLKADVVQYGKGGQQYEILADDSGDERGGPGPRGAPARPAPPPPGMGSGANTAPLPPRGRGSGAVLPAWMTSGGGAPGSGGGGPPPSEAAAAGRSDRQHVTSVEQALAILEEHARSKKDKKKKHKKEKKSKHKKEKRSKHKKERRSRHSSDSGSSSDSD